MSSQQSKLRISPEYWGLLQNKRNWIRRPSTIDHQPFSWSRTFPEKRNHSKTIRFALFWRVLKHHDQTVREHLKPNGKHPTSQQPRIRRHGRSLEPIILRDSTLTGFPTKPLEVMNSKQNENDQHYQNLGSKLRNNMPTNFRKQKPGRTSHVT